MADTFRFAPMSDRIRRIRARRDAFTGGKYMSINSERTKLYTEYYRSHEHEWPLLKRAGALAYWCANKACNVFDDDIFVGTPGPDERTLSPYVEWACSWLPGVVYDSDENFRKAWQSSESIKMTDEQREVFRDAYEFWKDRNLSRMVEGALTDDFWKNAGNGGLIGSDKGSPIFFGVSGMPQGHYIANFNAAVNKGFQAVKEEALAKLQESQGRVFGDTAEQHVFYQAVVTVCDGAMLLARRYAEACRQKAEGCADADRRAELLRMADSLDWIMAKPARSFWEGLQVIILYQLLLSTDAQQHGQSQGRVDQYVGHLLDAEIASGSLSREQAQEYSDAFILRLSDIIVLPGMADNRRILRLMEEGKNLYASIYDGLTPTAGIALTLGGMKCDGSDACNLATELLLNTYGNLHFPDPTVALRVCDSTPDHIWRLAIESSKRCGGIPQLQNDNIIIPALTDIGLSLEDARNYSIVGCVEPAGTGCEWPACGCTGRESIWNMVDVILLTIYGGVNPRSGVTALPCKKLYEYESFQEFKDAFQAQMQYILDWNVSYSNTFEMVYSHYFPCIAASTLMEGCMESGKDVTRGGAKYNRCGLTAIGTANVGDSLMTIKKLCFDDRSVSLRTLYDALEANWEGYEDLRQTILNEVPHYGNDIDEADELAAWGLGLFARIMAEAEGPRGHYSGGTFTMTAHMYNGAMTKATPDGRKDGEPLADAISARQGLDKNGPTAYLRSAAKLPHRALSNGDQLNIRFSPTAVEGEAGAMKLKSLIRTYFKLGGMQVQFNVVGTEQLRKAQAEPENYTDLVVRIAGFSTYFVSLSKATQDDFITRTEQSL